MHLPGLEPDTVADAKRFLPWRFAAGRASPTNEKLGVMSAHSKFCALAIVLALWAAVVPARATEHSDGPMVHFSIPEYKLTQIERETVAACLVLEAANQGDVGLRAVMSVIRNRANMRPLLFPLTVLRVKQFSALNPYTSGQVSLWRLIQRAKQDATWPNALAIVDEATCAAWVDQTAGATHYTRTGERTAWTRTLHTTARIGDHTYYR